MVAAIRFCFTKDALYQAVKRLLWEVSAGSLTVIVSIGFAGSIPCIFPESGRNRFGDMYCPPFVAGFCLTLYAPGGIMLRETEAYAHDDFLGLERYPGG